MSKAPAPRAGKPKDDRPSTLLPWQLPLDRIPPSAIVAIRAVAAGNANEHQQRDALAYIREGLCGRGKMSFWPGGEDGRRATDFAEGKRWVGDQLQRIVDLKQGHIDPRGPPPAMPGEPQE